MDYMSKWTNAIVIKVEEKKFQVVVDGGLEMEFQEHEIKGVIAPFQSKNKCSPERVQKLKRNVKNGKEEEKESTVITKKQGKGKRHQPNNAPQNQPPAQPVVEEPEKPAEVSMPFSFLETLDGLRGKVDEPRPNPPPKCESQ